VYSADEGNKRKRPAKKCEIKKENYRYFTAINVCELDFGNNERNSHFKKQSPALVPARNMKSL
jgi:hypothetical protein